MLLPFLEQTALSNAISLSDDGANFAFSSLTASPSVTSTSAGTRNVAAVETLLPVLQCPSAGLPNGGYQDASCTPWYVNAKQFTTYMPCFSSVVVSDQSPTTLGAFASDPNQRPNMNGILGLRTNASLNHVTSGPPIAVKAGEILDGLSNTVLFGEVLPGIQQRFNLTEDWYNASNPYATTGKITKKDHSAIGADDLDEGAGWDWSEAVCSLGVAINYKLPASPTTANISAWELSFGSGHAGGAHFTLGDGSVRFISDSVDTTIRQAIGSRNGSEQIGEF